MGKRTRRALARRHALPLPLRQDGWAVSVRPPDAWERLAFPQARQVMVLLSPGGRRWTVAMSKQAPGRVEPGRN